MRRVGDPDRGALKGGVVNALCSMTSDFGLFCDPFAVEYPMGADGRGSPLALESNPAYAFLRNDPPTRTDPTGPIPDQPPADQAFGARDTGGESARPDYLLVAADEEEMPEPPHVQARNVTFSKSSRNENPGL